MTNNAMVKKKSKSLDNNSVNTAMGYLKDNAKQIGATIAGLIVAEIVQATVERLLQTKDRNDSATEDTLHEDNGLQTLAASALSGLRGKVEEVKEPVAASVSSVKATASEVPPALSGIAELVKEATQKAIAQSIDSLGNSLDTSAATSQAVVGNAVDSTKQLVGAIASGNSEKANKKKKKGKKKKKS